MCRPGYELAADEINCSDIDECATETDTCDATYGVCTNTVGGYACDCTESFIVGPNFECEGKPNTVTHT